LHPRWQRLILPCFMQAVRRLTEGHGPELQMLISTHSPLVVASLEPDLDEATDRLWRLDAENGTVLLQEQSLERRGSADNWLHDLFELDYPGSIGREHALEEMRTTMSARVREDSKLRLVEEKLEQNAPSDDPQLVAWHQYRTAVSRSL
jgi:hypothetical protein